MSFQSLEGMYDAVLFDKDGVLLDSGLNNFLWLDRVRMKKASELGYDLSQEDSLQIVKSTEPREVEEILDKKGMTWKEMEKIEHKVQKVKINLTKQGIIRLFPKAEQVLANIDLKTSLVTNAPKMTTEFSLNYFSINEYFDNVQCLPYKPLKSYIENKKPHPTMLEATKEDLNAENPLMVGDSAGDIKAAKKANIDSVFIQNYKEDVKANPKYKIKNLEELIKLLN